MRKLRRDLRERFLNFETFNGAFLLIPWGAGFIYFGIFMQQYSYMYGTVSLGVILVIWGLRKTFVNRVKQSVRQEKMREDRAFYA